MLNVGIFEFLKVLIFANCGQSYVLGNLRHEEKRILMHEASVRGKIERKIYSLWKTKLTVRYLCVCWFLETPHLINTSFRIGLYICILATVGIGPYGDTVLTHFLLLFQVLTTFHVPTWLIRHYDCNAPNSRVWKTVHVSDRQLWVLFLDIHHYFQKSKPYFTRHFF